MEINVKMTTDEFLEFMEWEKDKKRYKEEESRTAKRLETFAKKVCWALESDKKRTGKAKSQTKTMRTSCWKWQGNFSHRRADG